VTTWSDRDLPVLYWLQEKRPQDGLLSTRLNDTPHPDLPALTERDVHVSVETLADEGLVSYTDKSWGGDGFLWTQFQVPPGRGMPNAIAATKSASARKAVTVGAESLAFPSASQAL
jgi:hypothetical protein